MRETWEFCNFPKTYFKLEAEFYFGFIKVPQDWLADVA